MSELSNPEPSTSTPASQLPPRNAGGNNLLTSGATNISGSKIDKLTNIEHADHVTVENPTINLHQTVNKTVNQTVKQTVKQTIIIHPAPVVQNEAPFDEESFRKHFTEMEWTYSDMFTPGRPITRDMYEHTPVVLESSFNELNTKQAKQQPSSRPREGTTKMAEVFPIENGVSDKEMVAIVGEPGGGKTVYLKTLQPYYIERGFYPFLFDFKSMDSSHTENVNFIELLKSACPDFPFDDSKTFGVWVNKNEKKILLLMDGLDQAPFPIISNVASKNFLTDKATIATWMSLLFQKKIMKQSKVIFTSRPASVTNLGVSQRPDKVYSLNGFSDESLDRVVRSYQSERTEEILSFIRSKGSNVVSYARNPFVISLISFVYKKPSQHSDNDVTADTTMTEIYRLAFEELSLSTHNQVKEGQSDMENKKVEEKVDKFYYDMFVENKWSFNGEDINKIRLDLKQFENLSWIRVFRGRLSNRIAPRDKIITPLHQSLMEYHVSRHIINMNVEDFEQVITKMYDLDDMDRWVMVRRFISGHINTTLFDEVKRELFLRTFVEELKNSTSEDLFEKYKYNIVLYNKASFLQAYLFNDMIEMKDQLQFIKRAFTGISGLRLQVAAKDVANLAGPILFLRNIDPHLRRLDITLPAGIKFQDLDRVVKAVEQLSKNVSSDMDLFNITQVDGNHVDQMKRIISKVDLELRLHYKNLISSDEFEKIKAEIHNHFETSEFTKTTVSMSYGNRRYLIRHTLYTSMTSSIDFLPTQMGDERITTSLVKLGIYKHFLPVVLTSQITRKKLDFDISDETELLAMIELLTVYIEIIARVPSTSSNEITPLGRIQIFLPSDIAWKHFQEFCQLVGKLQIKIDVMAIYNCKLSEAGWEMISLLVAKVKNSFYISYLDELNETEFKELQDKVGLTADRDVSPDLKIIAIFKNYHAIHPPNLQEWHILRFVYIYQ